MSNIDNMDCVNIENNSMDSLDLFIHVYVITIVIIIVGKVIDHENKEII